MKSSPSARHRARKLAVQALYQCQYVNTSPAQVVKEFIEDNDLKRADVIYFESLVLGASRDQTPLWQAIEPLLDRGGDEIDPVERSILLLGAFELKTQIEIPFKVVISEAVDIAKIFGATDSYKYINSILDRLALAFRAVETSALGR